jgi:hypothetical protein
MKVYEIMAKLAECEAGAEVRISRVFNTADLGKIQADAECPSYDGAVEDVDNGDTVYINGGASL